jgi:hypothetical protein
MDPELEREYKRLKKELKKYERDFGKLVDLVQPNPTVCNE